MFAARTADWILLRIKLIVLEQKYPCCTVRYSQQREPTGKLFVSAFK